MVSTAESENTRSLSQNSLYQGHYIKRTAVGKSTFCSTTADDHLEIKCIYTNAPVGYIINMPLMFQVKVINSHQWKWERE
jgi:hypothetical protein